MGFASGFPFSLTASVMLLRLKDSDVAISRIGLFSLVAVPYSFKYLWAPLIDGLNLPFLQKLLGKRRGWLCFIQSLLIVALFVFGAIDPQKNISLFALVAVCISFLSATQDIILDAYRIERLTVKLQGIGSSFTTYGWRIGSFISGVVPLLIAEVVSWSFAYYVASFIMVIGILTTLLSKEPIIERKTKIEKKVDFETFLINTFVLPFKELLKIEKIFFILAFIVLFKLGDAMAGVMTTPFLQDKGFTKTEIVVIVKTFGTVATFIGLFIGGLLAYKISLRYSLLIAGIFQMASNLLFVLQDHLGHNSDALIVTIFGENLASAIGATVFITYISSLCNVRFAATHYALLSSVATLARNVISSSSGFIVERHGWSIFFIVSTLAAIPGLLLLPTLTFFKEHRTSKTTT
jgi:PAT family beta-lactamase induction signal transducer AmpG